VSLPVLVDSLIGFAGVSGSELLCDPHYTTVFCEGTERFLKVPVLVSHFKDQKLWMCLLHFGVGPAAIMLCFPLKLF
jgi:hypothetical protein